MQRQKRSLVTATLVVAGSGTDWSDSVTPEPPTPPDPPATIVITGSRDGRTVQVKGTTTGLVGATVQSMVKLRGQTSYAPGSTRVVNDRGRFTWQRKTGKKVYVYFTSGDVRSERVIIR